MDTNNMNNNMNNAQFSGAQEMQGQAPQQQQAQQGYQTYQQPGYGAPATGPMTVNNYGYMPQEMTVGRWMLTLFLAGLPLVGLIMLIIWAVSSSPDNVSRKNWAIAQFVWTLIGIVGWIILAVVFGSSIAALGGSGAEFYGY